jgi:dTDP-4-amino-4,6-dideoxygalactose transaminase
MPALTAGDTMPPKGPIAFIDLKAQRARIGAAMEDAILSVVRSGAYVLGPEVKAFEQALAAFCGGRNPQACANGTDAIALCLMALEVRPGDAVICPSFTFAATAEVVAWLGATPVFVDIDERTYNIDPAGLQQAHDTALAAGLKPKAVIAVDLFGQTADYDAIEPFCAAHGLALIADTAQGFGARCGGRVAGSIGDFATTSFFPAKPLGCYGDGGALFSKNDEHAAIIRSLHFHGQGADRYEYARIGINSRLDTVQAAVLLQKLAVFDDEIARRQEVAARYTAGLSDVAVTPHVAPGNVSTWAQYTIRVPAAARQGFIDAMKEAQVPTAIYYPHPLHRQPAYRRFPAAGNGLPVTDRVCQEVVALPMHPYLDGETQAYIIEAARVALHRTA